MARLFFALWPDEAAARALGELSEALARVSGGRPVAPDKIHLTLVFLGELAEDREAAASEVAARCAAEPFMATFDSIGSFRGARVAWTGMREPPEPLLAFQRGLEAQLRAAHFALEERSYTPHITLARRIARPVGRKSVEPISWPARDFSLVRTQPGTGRYIRIENWKLKG